MGANRNSKERRINKRCPVRGCTITYEPDSVFCFFCHTSRAYFVQDISQTGIRFITKERFKEKTRLLLKIDGPFTGDKMIHAIGCVMWIEDGPGPGMYAVGVKCIAMSDEDRQRLRMLVSRARNNGVKISDLIDLKEAARIQAGVNPKCGWKKYLHERYCRLGE